MSSDERELLIEMLETSCRRVRAAIENAPDSVWGRKPADGGWSAAECAEHLVLAETTLLGVVREQVLGGPANPALAAELRGKDGVVVQAMQDRSVKHTTFDFLHPKGALADRRAALQAFLGRRAETIEYARTCAAAVHHHAAPLGPLGAINAYQWLLLMAAHSDRHVAQIEAAVR
jgi:DinB superfamily